MRNLIVASAALIMGLGPALADFSPSEARRLYGASSDRASLAFEAGDYVFLSVKWDAAAEDEEDGEEIAEMDAVERALCDYVHNGKKLDEKARCEYKVPETKSTVVLDETNKNPRRKVFAFDAAPLRAERERLNPNRNGGSDDDTPLWIRLLLFWKY